MDPLALGRLKMEHSTTLHKPPFAVHGMGILGITTDLRTATLHNEQPDRAPSLVQ